MISPCIQWDRLTKIEWLLDPETWIVMEKLKSMDKKIDDNHKEMKEIIAEIKNSFVLRSEFKVALSVISAIAVIIWLLNYFNK